MKASKRLETWLFGGVRRPRPRGVAFLLVVAHVTSLTALGLALLAAVVSRDIAPFHGWIKDTPLERAGIYMVALVSEQDLAWRHRLARLPLLSDEARARDSLTREIERLRPSHGVILSDGSTLFGRLEETGEGTFLLRYEGESGEVLKELRADDIRWRKKVVYPPVELSAQDVRFLLDFLSFKHYYLPPYLIVADVPYGVVQEAYEILADLASEFRGALRVLVTEEERSKLFYVCLFGNESDYLKYAIQKRDVSLENSVGFYSQTDDCLFVYDRLQSFARAKIDRKIGELTAEVNKRYGGVFSGAVQRLAEKERERSYERLRGQIVATLRHEGAHQLAFSLGVHSAAGFEHFWVQEGLAQYCETAPRGRLVPEKIELLAQAAAKRRLIPWQDLLNAPGPAGSAGLEGRADEAYAQAWLLCYYLMRPPSRARFIKYLATVHSLPVADLSRKRSDMLAACLATTPVELSRRLTAFISTTHAAAAGAGVGEQSRRRSP